MASKLFPCFFHLFLPKTYSISLVLCSTAYVGQVWDFLSKHLVKEQKKTSHMQELPQQISDFHHVY